MYVLELKVWVFFKGCVDNLTLNDNFILEK